MEPIRQSRPDSGLGLSQFQVKVLKHLKAFVLEVLLFLQVTVFEMFQVDLSSLGKGSGQTRASAER